MASKDQLSQSPELIELLRAIDADVAAQIENEDTAAYDEATCALQELGLDPSSEAIAAIHEWVVLVKQLGRRASQCLSYPVSDSKRKLMIEMMDHLGSEMTKASARALVALDAIASPQLRLSIVALAGVASDGRPQ
jgi:hypothetical protein